MDLRDLARVAPAAEPAGAVRAPHSDDPKLAAEIERLRAAGEVVVVDLPGHEGCGAFGCDRELALVDGRWQVKRI